MPMVVVIILAVVAAIVLGVVVNPVAALIPIIVGAIVANRTGYRHQGEATARAIAGTPAPPADDPAVRLQKLADLRDRGAITPEEFEAKKTELLARL